MDKYLICSRDGCNKPLKNCEYRVAKYGQRHVAGSCEAHGDVYLPYKEGLDIPTKKVAG